MVPARLTMPVTTAREHGWECSHPGTGKFQGKQGSCSQERHISGNQEDITFEGSRNDSLGLPCPGECSQRWITRFLLLCLALVTGIVSAVLQSAQSLTWSSASALRAVGACCSRRLKLQTKVTINPRCPTCGRSRTERHEQTPNTLPFCASLDPDLGFRLKKDPEKWKGIKKDGFPAAFAMAFFGHSSSVFWALWVSVRSLRAGDRNTGTFPSARRQPQSFRHPAAQLETLLCSGCQTNRQLDEIWGQKKWLHLEQQGHPGSATWFPAAAGLATAATPHSSRQCYLCPSEGHPSSFL